MTNPSLDELVALAAHAEARRQPGRGGRRHRYTIRATSSRRRRPCSAARWACTHPRHPVRNRLHHQGVHRAAARHRRPARRAEPGHARRRTPPSSRRPGQRRRADQRAASDHPPIRAPPLTPGKIAEARTVLIDRANPYRDLTPDRVLDAVAHSRLRRTPGTGRIAYSNLGVGLLGLALVNAARAGSYAELVRSRICVPLGMTDTDVLANIDPDRLAVGYQRGRPIDHWSLTGLAGAGALLSTGNDMLKFLAAQLQPGLDAADRSHHPQPPETPPHPRLRDRARLDRHGVDAQPNPLAQRRNRWLRGLRRVRPQTRHWHRRAGQLPARAGTSGTAAAEAARPSTPHTRVPVLQGRSLDGHTSPASTSGSPSPGYPRPQS